MWHGYSSGNRFSIWSKAVWSNSVYNVKLLPQCDMATSVVTDFQYGAKLFDIMVFKIYKCYNSGNRYQYGAKLFELIKL